MKNGRPTAQWVAGWPSDRMQEELSLSEPTKLTGKKSDYLKSRLASTVLGADRDRLEFAFRTHLTPSNEYQKAPARKKYHRPFKGADSRTTTIIVPRCTASIMSTHVGHKIQLNTPSTLRAESFSTFGKYVEPIQPTSMNTAGAHAPAAKDQTRNRRGDLEFRYDPQRSTVQIWAWFLLTRTAPVAGNPGSASRALKHSLEMHSGRRHQL